MYYFICPSGRYRNHWVSCQTYLTRSFNVFIYVLIYIAYGICIPKCAKLTIHMLKSSNRQTKPRYVLLMPLYRAQVVLISSVRCWQ
jgi:hypothetical protein